MKFLFPARTLLFVLCPLLFLSCSKTKREIALAPEMSVKVDAFLAEMKKIGEECPSEPIDLAGDLDPAPLFGMEGAINVIAAATDQLRDMESSINVNNDNRLNFYYGGAVASFLGDRYLSEKAPDGYEEELNDLLDRPYVLAIRVVAFDPPKIIDEKTFSGGAATVVAALYDRTKSRWHCAFQISRSPSDRVSFQTQEHRKEMSAKFYIRDSVREPILKEMKEKAGGGDWWDLPFVDFC